ncbi:MULTISPECIES: hypothetical protein [unclassified Novosphingobium]|jgi:hypothetical protein|uniref:hypothetical protein n=1 Tax=unclassified Novosphingobium TaxID=2644732 RepID=UPI000317DDF9|nr:MULTISPECIES: hypothetical protein [unclassified Novosphingobium]GFM28260.1 uncharacterized protein PY1_contig-04-308 [Novosphingobium sp. PY1]
MTEPGFLHLPEIDPASLPDPAQPIGLFGSYTDAAGRQVHDAAEASLEAYLYELHPGT